MALAHSTPVISHSATAASSFSALSPCSCYYTQCPEAQQHEHCQNRNSGMYHSFALMHYSGVIMQPCFQHKNNSENPENRTIISTKVARVIGCDLHVLWADVKDRLY